MYFKIVLNMVNLNIEVDADAKITKEEIERVQSRNSKVTKEEAMVAEEVQYVDSLIAWPKWVITSYVNAVKNLRCFETVRSMMVNGVPLVEISRQIIALGEGNGRSPETLRTILEHYKATLPKGELVSRVQPQAYVNAKKKFDQESNELSDFLEIKEIAIKRMKKFSERELALGFPIPNGDKAVELALKCVQAVALYKERIGLTKLDGDSDGGSINRYDFDSMYQKSGMNETLKDPASRLRIVRFIEQTVGIYGSMSPEKQQSILALKAKIEADKVKAKQDIESSDFITVEMPEDE